MNTKYPEESTELSDNVAEIHEDPMNPIVEPIADKPSVSESTPEQIKLERSLPGKSPLGANDGSLVPLLNAEDAQRFRKTWNELQGTFVDQPRPAVEQADALVSEVIKQLLQLFAREHTALEGQWNQGNDVSTEDLRQALLRYHSFFNRLTA
ncbi:MAG TPA: hypothetical protein VIU38_02990 [Anaerolineales bacterium]